mmetsp:Transcript_9162/g.33596  ORF Transcript_9162/g.33596 Transcript_9162/m.33596 type:complete len:369 (-) Transcript_9162:21-1127(-)
MAPKISVSPERKAHMNPLRREPVAKYTGTATQAPSGMLCSPMAIAMATPSDSSAKVATKVASPSGKLCRAMAIAVMVPILPSPSYSPLPGASEVAASPGMSTATPSTVMDAEPAGIAATTDSCDAERTYFSSLSSSLTTTRSVSLLPPLLLVAFFVAYPSSIVFGSSSSSSPPRGLEGCVMAVRSTWHTHTGGALVVVPGPLVWSRWSCSCAWSPGLSRSGWSMAKSCACSGAGTKLGFFCLMQLEMECTRRSSNTVTMTPPKKDSVAQRLASGLSLPASSKASTALRQKISAKDTYSITPALAPKEAARKRLLASDVQKTKQAPTVVLSPAAITRPKARPTLPSAWPMLAAGVAAHCLSCFVLRGGR